MFSLDAPWQSVCNASGMLQLRLFEPRYVELARRVFPPAGQGKFGYAEAYPPKAGGAGVLAQVEEFKWAPAGGQGQGGQEEGQVALLNARGARRFRILAVRQETVVEEKPQLYVAHVQLLEDRDLARGTGRESWDYWTQPASSSSAGPGPERAKTVKAGTALVARQAAAVFEAMESWRVVAQVPAGVAVVAAGPPRMVEGYLMVPIMPSGAVELTLFRELSMDSEGPPMPTEQDLRRTLLNLGKEPVRPEPSAGGEAGEAGLGRKSQRRRGGG